MEILDIQMKHFGKFSNQAMSFHSGVNVIYGENETGKSTVHAFIKAMLYGIERLRGRASKKDEYSMREPWENGSYFAGSMRFESGGKIFCLERNFARKEMGVHLFCETDGEELDAEQGDLAMLLEGMSEKAFSNTVFIGQQTGETDEGLAASVRNFMVNAQSGGLRQVDVKKAVEKLNKERKELESDKKKAVTERIENLQEIRMKADYLEQEIEEICREEKECRDKLKEFQSKEKQEEMRDAQFERQDRYQPDGGRNPWRWGKVSMAILASAALGVALVMNQWEIRAAAIAVILLSCLGVRYFASKDQEYKDERKEQELKAREQKMRQEYERQQMILKRQSEEAPKRQKLMLNLEWIRNTKKEKEMQLQALKEQYEEMQNANGKIEELEEKLSAVYLALDTLEEVTAEIYRDYGRRLNARVSQIIGEITGGRYEKIFLDDCLRVKIQTSQKLLSVDQVSRGTMEQIYFALRMAAAELLNQGESFPVLLDDAFAMYDDTRLEHTLRWLCSCGHQVILFTCHKREQEILQRICSE